MERVVDIKTWWHGVAALPSGRSDPAYFALRRVWGDHTIAGARGFYRRTSEDHLTVALFHNWALFPDVSWVASLVRACGGQAGTVTRANWAYACEEQLDSRLQPHHGRNFIIPDIFLHFVDEHGPALLAFEVKRPGTAAKPDDARKLRSYVDLPSTRGIARRFGCFLVGGRHVAATREGAQHAFPVLSWEELRALQVEAAGALALPEPIARRVVAWLSRAYARAGIGTACAAPEPLAGNRLASGASYEPIRAMNFAGSLERFLLGSECVEVATSELEPDAPYAWLAHEPSADEVRRRQFQTTPERRINRWHSGWDIAQEPVWP